MIVSEKKLVFAILALIISAQVSLTAISFAAPLPGDPGDTPPPSSDCSGGPGPCVTTEGKSGTCVWDSAVKHFVCEAIESGGDKDKVPGGDKGPPPGGDQGSFDFPNPLKSKTFTELVTNLADFIIELALVFAVIIMIIAGFWFATAQGNEDKITAAKRNFTWAVVGIAIILASKLIVTYIQELLGVKDTKTSTLNAFIDKLKGTMNSLIIILFSLATIYFFWGVVQYVVGAAGDETKLEQGKRHMVWGIIGMAIMASAFGIVKLIKEYVT